MLTVEDLHVSYGNVPAVKGVSFEIGDGQIVGLIGANGAGKTTTLSAIFGLVQITAGSIAFDGRSLLGQAPEWIVQWGLALVPEGRMIFGTLTVAENLQLGATVRRDPAAVRHETEALLERFPVLRRYYRKTAGNLSGGEQQQLAIARALLSKPRLLVLDEPSLGLAPLIIDQVFDTLAELRDEGTTILLVEQNAARAVELADYTYVLRTGHVAFSGTRTELLHRADFESSYLGAAS
jgi:branched-chain amino acid transport system ATP-binding protein